MRRQRIRPVPDSPAAAECQNAHLILRHTHETCDALGEAFYTIRPSGRGATTDEQQDILRAILVFACAGLDSMLKQLIRDAVPRLAAAPDSSAREALHKFVRRRLGATEQDETASLDREFFTRVLLSECTLTGCVEAVIQEKTGRSLQSRQQIEDVLPHLGLDNHAIMGSCRDGLQQALDARNAIVHEMDIDFRAARRNRFQRTIGRTFEQTNLVLELAAAVLAAADTQISALRPDQTTDQ